MNLTQLADKYNDGYPAELQSKFQNGFTMIPHAVIHIRRLFDLNLGNVTQRNLLNSTGQFHIDADWDCVCPYTEAAAKKEILDLLDIDLSDFNFRKICEKMEIWNEDTIFEYHELLIYLFYEEFHYRRIMAYLGKYPTDKIFMSIASYSGMKINVDNDFYKSDLVDIPFCNESHATGIVLDSGKMICFDSDFGSKEAEQVIRRTHYRLYKKKLLRLNIQCHFDKVWEIFNKSEKIVLETPIQSQTGDYFCILHTLNFGIQYSTTKSYEYNSQLHILSLSDN
jgi:hypothetical protein